VNVVLFVVDLDAMTNDMRTSFAVVVAAVVGVVVVTFAVLTTVPASWSTAPRFRTTMPTADSFVVWTTAALSASRSSVVPLADALVTSPRHTVDR
jgi:hypothetical protein